MATYNEQEAKGLFTKIRAIIFSVGEALAVLALTLWFCMIDDRTSFVLKSLIFGDLVYLISPIDVVPDFTPVVGFSDDLALLTLTVTYLGSSIREEHKERARKTYDTWTN